MRPGDQSDTEDPADEDALAQVREGESETFGSWDFERSKYFGESLEIVENVGQWRSTIRAMEAILQACSYLSLIRQRIYC